MVMIAITAPAKANFGLVWCKAKARRCRTITSCHERAAIDGMIFAQDSKYLRHDLNYEQNGGLNYCVGEQEFENRRNTLQKRLHNQLGGNADWEMVDRSQLEKLMPGVDYGPDVVALAWTPRWPCEPVSALLLALHAANQRLGGIIVTSCQGRDHSADCLRIFPQNRSQTYSASVSLRHCGGPWFAGARVSGRS